MAVRVAVVDPLPMFRHGVTTVLAGRCVATLVTPRRPTGAGVIIAHGGSGDGRRFFMTEALALAGRGMTVLLPVVELPRHGDIEDLPRGWRFTTTVCETRSAADQRVRS